MTFASIPGLLQPVSRIVLGTASLGDPLAPGEGSSRATVRAFDLLSGILEAGGNAFDTARVYRLGASERLLGNWMKKTGNRGNVVVITKGGHPSLLTFRSRMRGDAIALDLERSLRDLQTDFVDLFLLHRDDPRVPVAAIIEILHSLRESGRVRACGVSNWGHERIDEANRFARSQGIPELAASSPQFSLAEWRRPPFPGCISISGGQGAAARAWHQESGVAVLAWSSLAGGYFNPQRGPAPRGIYGHPGNEGRLLRAQEMAQRKGVTAAQVALAFLLSQPFPVFPVVSTHSVRRFRENAEATGIRLSPAELAWLESGGEI